MSRAARLLLIWIVVAAVPLKGLAAVLMMGCGPGHAAGAPLSHGNGPAAIPAAPVAGHHHDHGLVHGDAHGHAHGHAHGPTQDTVHHDALDRVLADDPAAPATQPDADGGAKAHHGQALKCSTCAPCCAAAAPAPQGADVPRTPPVSVPATFTSERYSGIVFDVPDRPPRTLLA